MKIIYPGAISVLHDAVAAANKLLVDPAFYDAIAQKPSFAASGATGAQVAASMQRCDLALTVKTYKNPLSRALGYENPHDPTSIFINIAGNKLSRSVGSIAATFIHEAVHAADADDESIEYAHRGNRPAGNEDTAPYWIGDLAARMIDAPMGDPSDSKLLIYTLGEMLPEDTGPNFRIQVRVESMEHTPARVLQLFIKKMTPDMPTVYESPKENGSFDTELFLPSGHYKAEVIGTGNPKGKIRATLSGDFAYPPKPNFDESSDFTFTLRFLFYIY